MHKKLVFQVIIRIFSEIFFRKTFSFARKFIVSGECENFFRLKKRYFWGKYKKRFGQFLFSGQVQYARQSVISNVRKSFFRLKNWFSG